MNENLRTVEHLGIYGLVIFLIWFVGQGTLGILPREESSLSFSPLALGVLVFLCVIIAVLWKCVSFLGEKLPSDASKLTVAKNYVRHEVRGTFRGFEEEIGAKIRYPKGQENTRFTRLIGRGHGCISFPEDALKQDALKQSGLAKGDEVKATQTIEKVKAA